jgi:hypothetical protein
VTMMNSQLSRLGLAIVVAGLLFSLPEAASSQTPSVPQLKDFLSPLAYFAGDWECSGKFDSSGKAIEAHQRFAPELDGAWMTFRHDDKPPFGYHALAEWGWDAARKGFVMTVQDSAGGWRLLRSSGWNSEILQWDGGSASASSDPNERFSFERLDDRHFIVSYFTLKNGGWSRMDSSTCSKQ